VVLQVLLIPGGIVQQDAHLPRAVVDQLQAAGPELEEV
jgi:hypothetical protein